MLKTSIFVLFITLAFSALLQDKIQKEVHEDFLQKGTSGFSIILKSFPDFEAIVEPTTGKLLKELDLKTKRITFYNTLRIHSELSQISIKKFLNENNVVFTSLWINNVIYVQESASNTFELVQKIAQREDVQEIITARTQDLHFENAISMTHANVSTSKQQNVEWNVKLAKGPEIWAKGAKGQGVVVANIDTGIAFNHPGLVKQYRGHNNGKFEHDFNWWDGVRTGQSRGCELASKTPCDDHGHGTHTIGTVVGATANDVVGIAPDAKWIGCRGFNVGFLSAGAVEGCMQFFLAPHKQDGTGANPELAPDVIGHSYGVPDSDALKRAFAAVEVAGIINVASAGNSASCRTILRVPGIYKASLTVGALGYQTQRIASFSSKGPGPASYKVQKPEIAASGERVNSWARNGGKVAMSGTSMSSPLVAGAIAALWSKFADFKNKIEETVRILEKNIDVINNSECGSPQQSPNYVYGFGNLNSLKAFEAMESKRKMK